MLPGELATEGATCPVDGTAEDVAVRAREVHVLEYAPLEGQGGHLERAHPLAVDGDDLPRLHFAYDGGANDVECAGLGREYPGIAEPAHRERTPPARIAGGHEGLSHHDHEAGRSFDARQGIGQPVLRLRGGRPRHQVDDDLGIHRRREDRAPVLEVAPQLDGVHQVPVMCQRDVAVAKTRQHRLGVLQCRRTGGAVSRVPDGDGTVQGRDVSGCESLRYQSHLAHAARDAIGADGDNARRLLAPVLERVQSKVRQRSRALMTPDSENTTHAAAPDSGVRVED